MSSASASHRVTLDAFAEMVNAQSTSASWNVGSAFPLHYRPQGEVLALQFSDRDTLQWQPERSVVHDNDYRDLITVLSGGVFGRFCQSSLTDVGTKDGMLLSRKPARPDPKSTTQVVGALTSPACNRLP